MEFFKKILSPGRYLVNDLAGGRRTEHFTTDRFKSWIATFNRMREAGLSVPAPTFHDPQAVPLLDTAPGKPSTPSAGSFQNKGWWKDLFIDPASGSLFGRLEIPLAEDAARIGTTVKDVSPLVRKSWTDGLGRTWEDAILHIGLVTHPVAPGQENFQPILDGAMAFSLSSLLPENAAMADDDKSKVPPDSDDSDSNDSDSRDESGTAKETGAHTIGEALEALSSVGLTLPDDTTPDNLIERICVAAGALAAKKSSEAPEGSPPSGSTEKPPPIVMGDVTIMAPTPAAISTIDKGLAFASRLARHHYAYRVKALVESGRIPFAMAKARLQPLVEGIQLSLSDLDDAGNLKPNSLDATLDLLESVPSVLTDVLTTPGQKKSRFTASPKPTASFAAALQEEDIPPEYLDGGSISDDEADNVVLTQLRNTGRLPPLRSED